MSRTLLGEQFSDEVVEVGNKHIKHPRVRTPMSDPDTVYGQLTDDYPITALKWVHSVDWTGPKNIPTSKVDWDDVRVWKAAHETEHVNAFVKKIKEETAKGDHVKPVVLINRPVKPEEAPYMIADGHHRAWAYKKLNKKIWAWEGKVKRRSGPWDYLHDSQFKEATGKNSGKNIYR